MDKDKKEHKLKSEEKTDFTTKICERTESDAVHPRFANITKEVSEEYRREYYYYCTFCCAYFAPTILGLREHFKVGRIDHEQIASCIYCQGPVYNYSIDNRIKLYHDCQTC